jgi:anti-anti-sigma factor
VNRTAFEPDFKVTVTRPEATGPVITVCGELDSGTCDELLEAFRSILTAGVTGTVTLDLSGVGFIDSAGTRSVIMLDREARDRGVRIVITAPPDEVTDLLRTAGVIEHFELRPGVGRTTVDSSTLLERIELELPIDPHSPARARAEVRELLSGHGQAHTVDAILLTSEIVTNAVVHPVSRSSDGIGLRIFTFAEGLRVEVDDGGGGFEPARLAGPGPEGGRGIYLVDQFASRWGTEHVEDHRGARFMIWFELDWHQPRNLEMPVE